MYKKTILLISRVLLFCIVCAVILIVTSGITKGLPLPYSNICSIGIASLGTFLVTIVFIRWEGLNLKNVGVMPGNKTMKRLFIGLGIGALLAMLQPLLVIAFGHVSMEKSPETGFFAVASSFILYFLIACREEIAFRGYPMSALNTSVGAWGAQIIIAIIFIIEHRLGGMNWLQAVIGPGMGAIFFGMAVLKTRGLALSTGLHTSWNFVQWFLGFKQEQGIYHVTVEKGFESITEWIGWASYIFVIGLGICIIQLGWKKNRQEV